MARTKKNDVKIEINEEVKEVPVVRNLAPGIGYQQAMIQFGPYSCLLTIDGSNAYGLITITEDGSQYQFTGSIESV